MIWGPLFNRIFSGEALYSILFNKMQEFWVFIDIIIVIFNAEKL